MADDDDAVQVTADLGAASTNRPRKFASTGREGAAWRSRCDVRHLAS